MGLGGFPAPHEQWLGMLGMHGTRAANYAMDEADLIVAIGARFDDRITGKLSEFAPRAKFIHIDIDPAEISKNVAGPHPDRRRREEHPAAADRRVPGAATADAGEARGVVVADPRLAGAPPARLRGLQGRRDQAAVHDPGALRGDRRRRDRHQRRRPAPDVDRAVLPLPRAAAWINSGGLGTMGFGLPAAMGAKVGCPDETVVCIAGDGSVQMNMQELATCAQEGIAIKVFIMNNGYPGDGPPVAGAVLGQALQPGRHGPVAGLRQARWCVRRDRDAARGQEDARRGIKEALATEGPVLVDVRVTREENTYPMIPRASPRGTWWARGGPLMGEPGTKEVLSLDELEAVAGQRTAASTSSRSLSRTSPVS